MPSSVISDPPHARADRQAEAISASGWAAARWPALGTSAQVIVTEPAVLPTARRAVERLLEGIDAAANRFRADSELTRLNSARGSWLDVSPLFARALRAAIDAAAWTDGLVDPTVGRSLVDLGYDRTYRHIPPDGPPVAVRLRPDVTWRAVDLRYDELRVRIPPGTTVDLGATAKGLASDLAATDAAAEGACGVLVNLGGDLAVAGPSPGNGWPVAVTDLSDPDLPDGPAETVAVSAGGLATSSTRARRWHRGGSEIHHILDPRTASPASGPWRTVSVAADTCLLANSASTAAVVAGDGAADWLAARGFAARLVGHSGNVLALGGWPVAGATHRSHPTALSR